MKAIGMVRSQSHRRMLGELYDMEIEKLYEKYPEKYPFLELACNEIQRDRKRRKERRVMRGIFIALVSVFLLVAGWVALADAQTWHTANQVTVAWDAPTTLENGDPILGTDTIEYAIYIANVLTDPAKANPALVEDNHPATSYTLTLGVEGQYFVGLQSIRKISDGTEVGRSTICWSDVVACAPDPFGVRYFVPPAGVTNLHVP